jgi:hypothetical protein
MFPTSHFSDTFEDAYSKRSDTSVSHQERNINLSVSIFVFMDVNDNIHKDTPYLSATMQSNLYL